MYSKLCVLIFDFGRAHVSLFIRSSLICSELGDLLSDGSSFVMYLLFLKFSELQDTKAVMHAAVGIK
jgi:hypothetical protein